MKKLLITGGAGFIGSNFIRYLMETGHYQITNVDALTYAGSPLNMVGFDENTNYRFFRGDITCPGELEQVFDCHYDIIIHFAAETHVDNSIDNVAPFLNTNIIGTHHLLHKMLENKADKMIHISTDEVYGSLNVGEDPFTEASPLLPNNPYAASKASAEMLVRSFYKTYELPLIITRCSNNYGPYQHREKLIPKTITNAIQDISIPIYGDGKNIRDWLHVKDHCRGIHLVMESGNAGEIYNIGGNQEKLNIEMVRMILKNLCKGDHLMTFVKDRQGHDLRYSLSAEKIKRELGWKPLISLEKGIAETVEWYRQRLLMERSLAE